MAPLGGADVGERLANVKAEGIRWLDLPNAEANMEESSRSSPIAVRSPRAVHVPAALCIARGVYRREGHAIPPHWTRRARYSTTRLAQAQRVVS